MHSPVDDSARPTDPPGVWVFGTIALLLAAAVPCLAVIEWAARIDLPMPHTWYSARRLWYFGAVLSAIVGVRLLRSSGRPKSPEGWKPTRPGRRFDRVRLYTREECHLCDHARDSLWKHAAWLPALEEVDIDADPQLAAQFDTCVPVVEIDGKIRFRGRVDEVLLRRLIENTPPAAEFQ